MPLYSLDIDRIHDDLYYELERISEGQRLGDCTVETDNPRNAAQKIVKKLKPLIQKNLKQVF